MNAAKYVITGTLALCFYSSIVLASTQTTPQEKCDTTCDGHGTISFNSGGVSKTPNGTGGYTFKWSEGEISCFCNAS